MEFKRINDDTVRCIINEEDMNQYNVAIEDFLENNSKVIDFLHKLVERAADEIGYEPDSNMLSMQVVPLPMNRLSITFTEGGKGENAAINSILDEHKEELKKVQKKDSGLQIVVFTGLEQIIQFCSQIPENILITSNLYKNEKDNMYYLTFIKGRISRDNFMQVCSQVKEFGTFYTDSTVTLAYLNEHCTCLIEKNAIRKLRRL